jgi:hypothetical protein
LERSDLSVHRKFSFTKKAAPPALGKIPIEIPIGILSEILIGIFPIGIFPIGIPIGI